MKFLDILGLFFRYRLAEIISLNGAYAIFLIYCVAKHGNEICGDIGLSSFVSVNWLLIAFYLSIVYLFIHTALLAKCSVIKYSRRRWLFSYIFYQISFSIFMSVSPVLAFTSFWEWGPRLQLHILNAIISFFLFWRIDSKRSSANYGGKQA